MNNFEKELKTYSKAITPKNSSYVNVHNRVFGDSEVSYSAPQSLGKVSLLLCSFIGIFILLLPILAIIPNDSSTNQSDLVKMQGDQIQNELDRLSVENYETEKINELSDFNDSLSNNSVPNTSEDTGSSSIAADPGIAYNYTFNSDTPNNDKVEIPNTVIEPASPYNGSDLKIYDLNNGPREVKKEKTLDADNKIALYTLLFGLTAYEIVLLLVYKKFKN